MGLWGGAGREGEGALADVGGARRGRGPVWAGLTVRAHVPAQVAAVLEHLAADAALVDTPVLPQLPHQLPPDAVSAGEDEAPLESDTAALMMGEPARLDKHSGKTGGRLGFGVGGCLRLQSSEKSSQGDGGRREELGVTQCQGRPDGRGSSFCASHTGHCLWLWTLGSRELSPCLNKGTTSA